jgi:uncharacterized protein YgbK (DUF1537 family)
MGRTVKDGQLFVYGIPVHQTEFADDLLNPVRDCTIRGVLGDAEALVLDGECDADTEAAAERILEQSPPQICAGPAALAQALARRLGPATEPAVSIPLLSRCLVINGSLHPVSIRQMEAAEQQGLFDDHWQRLDNKDIEGSGAERARHTGNCVRRILSSSRFDALIVFGGDTVFGIHQALGAPPFEALGEIAPGVPLSTAGGLVWITKAGGFGPPDVLSIIKKRLT